MRTTLKIAPSGAVSGAFCYLAPGLHPGFAVVEVWDIPSGTPPAEVLALYTERLVNAYPYGPFRVSWAHLLKLRRPATPNHPAQ